MPSPNRELDDADIVDNPLAFDGPTRPPAGARTYGAASDGVGAVPNGSMATPDGLWSHGAVLTASAPSGPASEGAWSSGAGPNRRRVVLIACMVAFVAVAVAAWVLIRSGGSAGPVASGPGGAGSTADSNVGMAGNGSAAKGQGGDLPVLEPTTGPGGMTAPSAVATDRVASPAATDGTSPAAGRDTASGAGSDPGTGTVPLAPAAPGSAPGPGSGSGAGSVAQPPTSGTGSGSGTDTGTGSKPSASTGTGSSGSTANPYTPTQVCGSGYRQIDQHSLGSGATTARIYLLYNAGRNCVVTMKSGTGVGKAGAVSTWVQVQGSSTRHTDSGSYKYYAGPAYVDAPRTCVKWGGSIGGTSWASDWGHCG